jgi:hypothetical protein
MGFVYGFLVGVLVCWIGEMLFSMIMLVGKVMVLILGCTGGVFL